MEATLLQTLTKDAKSVVIFTDLEPDDLAALTLLLPHVKLDLKIVVSCWKDVRIKCCYLSKYLNDKPGSKPQIFMGIPTDKKYDISSLVIDDGTQTFPPWTDLSWDSEMFILQLAPVFELMKLYQSDHQIFKNKTMAIYASFNVRSTIGKKGYTSSSVRDMICSFKQTLYYETFYATDPVEVNDAEILDKMLAKDPLLGDSIKWWNAEIYEEMKHNKCERSVKIIKSIDACPMQFVHADTGLITTLLLPIESIRDNIFSGNLSYSEPEHYSVFTNLTKSSTDESFLVITGSQEDKRSLFDKQMKIMVTI